MGLLDGKVAIVTGSGGGLGREHALALAAEGAAVLVNDLGGARDGTGAGENMADKVVDEIKAAGGEAAANYDNVSTVEGGRNILKGALDAFDQVDILVNNAGILRDKSFANTTEDLWDPVVAVHLKGTYCVTHAVYGHMKERGQGGVVINTSSTSGLNGNFGQCNYGAAKAGIAGFSRCLAIEGVKYGVRVHILAPVAVTRLTEDLPGFDESMRDRMNPGLVSPPGGVSVERPREGRDGQNLLRRGRADRRNARGHPYRCDQEGRRGSVDAPGSRGAHDCRGHSSSRRMIRCPGPRN